MDTDDVSSCTFAESQQSQMTSKPVDRFKSLKIVSFRNCQLAT